MAIVWLGSLPSASGLAFQFDIPAQPLGTALLEYARQAQVEFVVAEGPIAGVSSNKVHGVLAPSDALSRLLECTGFMGNLDNGIIRLESARARTPPSAQSASDGATCNRRDRPLLVSEGLDRGGDELSRMNDRRADFVARA